jgi:hypothetical protein
MIVRICSAMRLTGVRNRSLAPMAQVTSRGAGFSASNLGSCESMTSPARAPDLEKLTILHGAGACSASMSRS